jgi:hypothetical protein
MGFTEPGGFVESPDGALVHFIDLDLHAEALHTEVNDPIVLIHGLGCSWHHWSRQIGLQYTLDHPEEISRLALLASLPGPPAKMAEARESQMAFIKSHNLREIAENRVGAALTESVDQGVKAWMVDMIGSGDKEIPNATLHVLTGEGHFANVQVPRKGQPAPRRRIRNSRGTCPEAVSATVRN